MKIIRLIHECFCPKKKHRHIEREMPLVSNQDFGFVRESQQASSEFEIVEQKRISESSYILDPCIFCEQEIKSKWYQSPCKHVFHWGCIRQVIRQSRVHIFCICERILDRNLMDLGLVDKDVLFNNQLRVIKKHYETWDCPQCPYFCLNLGAVENFCPNCEIYFNKK